MSAKKIGEVSFVVFYRDFFTPVICGSVSEKLVQSSENNAASN